MIRLYLLNGGFNSGFVGDIELQAACPPRAKLTVPTANEEVERIEAEICGDDVWTSAAQEFFAERPTDAARATGH